MNVKQSYKNRNDKFENKMNKKARIIFTKVFVLVCWAGLGKVGVLVVGVCLLVLVLVVVV